MVNKINLLYFTLTICVLITNIYSQGTCSNNNNQYKCQTNKDTFDEAWGIENVFQTPFRNHHNWQPAFQDMHKIVGYVQQKYTTNKNECTVTVNYRLNTLTLPLYSDVLFKFGDHISSNNVFVVNEKISSKYKENGLPVSVSIVNYLHQVEASLEFDPIYFKWDNIEVTSLNGKYGAIVELFGWPYEDIQKECEFLGENRYLGVQILPPVETILDFNSTVNGVLNPWHYAYQPVSYKLNSRMGTHKQLRAMINKCREHGVRVYSETIINHMTTFGTDSYPRHQKDDSGCTNYGRINSTGGSPWYTGGNMNENNEMTNKITGLEFPAVPYDSRDFHCDSNTEFKKWNKRRVDLNTEREYVQQRIADHLTELISIGISGFSFDEVNLIPKNDVVNILNKLKVNLGNTLPDDFLVHLNVLLGGDANIFLCGNEKTSYGYPFYNSLSGWSDQEKQSIKIWRSDYPKEYPKCNIKIGDKYQSLLSIDVHLEQFENTNRGIEEKLVYVLNKNKEAHQSAIKTMFSQSQKEEVRKNDFVLILSSYHFNGNTKRADIGIPDGYSDCNMTSDPKCDKSASLSKVTAFDSGSKGYDQTGYTRVHRDSEIIASMKAWLESK